MRRKKNRENYKRFINILSGAVYLLIYVFLYLKIIQAGYKIEKLKEEYEHLNLMNKNYNLQLTEMVSPEKLEKIAKEKNINLIIPKNWCFLEIKKEDENAFKETEILEAGTR